MQTNNIFFEESFGIFGMAGSNQLAIGEFNNGVNGSCVAIERMKIPVWSAIGVNANQAVSAEPVIAGKPSADVNVACCPDLDNPAPAIKPRAHQEGCVPRAVCI